MSTRILAGLAVFLVGAAVCSLWAYKWVAPIVAPVTGSGGIGFVSVGVPELVLGFLALVAPPLMTIRLTRVSDAVRLATLLRRSHLVVTVALVAVGVFGLFDGSVWGFVAGALFLPVQVFFATGALALWIATRRRPGA